MGAMVTGMLDFCTRCVRDVLGISATYTPVSTGVAVSIVAPFDDPYQELVLAGGEAMTAEAPAIDVRIADLPAYPEQGDLVVLTRPSTGSSASFRVEDVRLGGQGTAKLFLSVVGS